MARRPPLAAARQSATKRLIEIHEEEHAALVQEYLDREGWHQEEYTRKRWVSSAPKPEKS